MSKDGELTVFPNMTFYADESVPTCHRSVLFNSLFLSVGIFCLYPRHVLN